MNVRLEPGWKALLETEFTRPYFINLTDKVRLEYATHPPIYPPGGQIFRALDLCPPGSVRAVILGQDPYHEPGQAEGLAFSVPDGIPAPPSLRNILQEVNSDLGHPSQIRSSSLLPWVEQGVLLLNATLTVRGGMAGSHQGIGWETFTDRIIEIINRECRHVVFMLWGSYARRKGAMIDHARHCVLEAPHPSPLSAHRGFFGCRHFSQANDYLIKNGLPPIRW